MAEVIMRLEGVRKEYFRKGRQTARYFNAVESTTLEIAQGDVVACVGRSGSGKTTLLTMMAGLLEPSEGHILLNGQDLYALSDNDLSKLRNTSIGVIPQGHTPVHSLTLLQNVMLPALMYAHEHEARVEQRATQLLEGLHLADLIDSYPAELSGGELRRMAVVRALAASPKLILADEPTGDLDDATTCDVLEALQQAAQLGASVFMVTHDSQALPFATRVVEMNAGTLQEVGEVNQEGRKDMEKF